MGAAHRVHVWIWSIVLLPTRLARAPTNDNPTMKKSPPILTLFLRPAANSGNKPRCSINSMRTRCASGEGEKGWENKAYLEGRLVRAANGWATRGFRPGGPRWKTGISGSNWRGGRRAMPPLHRPIRADAARPAKSVPASQPLVVAQVPKPRNGLRPGAAYGRKADREARATLLAAGRSPGG